MTSGRLIFALTGLLIATGCGRKIPLAAGPTIPQDELLYRQGLSAFHEGTPEGYARAVDAFRRAAAIRPQRCEYPLNLSQALLFLAAEQRSNWEEFEPRQSEAISLLGSAGPACASWEPFISRLRGLISGRGPEGSSMVNRALDLDADDPMNWLIHGKVDPVGRIDPSGRQQVAIVRAGDLQPDSALIRFELGNYLLYDKPLEAKQAFERTIELNPRHFRAYLGLAYTASADETVDVEPYYRKVVELAPNFLEGRMALGNYYAGIEELGQAAEQYNAALAANPKYDVAQFRLGLIALYLELLDEAETRFNAVVQLNPMSYEAYYHLGNIWYTRRDLDKAKAQYEQALKYRVNYVDPNYGLGNVFRDQGDNDKALAQFEKVIRIAPQHADAYFSRASIRAERRQLFEAFADLQKAIQLYEQQVRGLDAKVAYAGDHPQSRFAQAERKRAERDKVRVADMLGRARQYKTEVEEEMARNF